MGKKKRESSHSGIHEKAPIWILGKSQKTSAMIVILANARNARSRVFYAIFFRITEEKPVTVPSEKFT